MTTEEALVFLGAHEGDDLKDAFDDQLFEFRRFFTSKPIIGKTFRHRLEKLKLIDEAAKVLGLENGASIIPELKKIEPNGTILHDFLNYQDLKSDWMLQMHNAETPEQMMLLTDLMLEMEFEYTGLWKDAAIESESVILSKEPDPMALLSDIKHAAETGIVTFSDLAGDLTDRFELLKRESKRMYLLHEKEKEWKTSM